MTDAQRAAQEILELGVVDCGMEWMEYTSDMRQELLERIRQIIDRHMC